LTRAEGTAGRSPALKTRGLIAGGCASVAPPPAARWVDDDEVRIRAQINGLASTPGCPTLRTVPHSVHDRNPSAWTAVALLDGSFARKGRAFAGNAILTGDFWIATSPALSSGEALSPAKRDFQQSQQRCFV
jgi:hypothetical protein